MRRDGETLSRKKDRLVNVKAEEAKARKFILEWQRREIEALEKEDLEWRKAEEEDKSRVAKKREEEAKKRAEAAVRKAQNRMLALQEERDLERMFAEYYRKINKVPLPELQIQMGDPNRAKKFVVEKPKHGRIVDQSDYSKMILVPNKNLIVDREISVEEAVDVMTERAHKLVWDKCNHWVKYWRAKWPGMKEHYTSYLYASDEDDDFLEYEDPFDV